MAGDKVLYEQEYYSVGGGFIEWKGYEPPKKGQPKYPYATMKELRQHAEKNNLSIADVVMANEIAVSGKSEERDQRLPGQDRRRDARDGEGPACPSRTTSCPGRSSCTPRPRPSGSAPRTRSTKAIARSRWSRPAPCRLRGECPRPPGHHRAHGRLGRGHAGHRLCPDREQAEGADGEDPRGSAGRRWPSATCASTTRRSRRPRAAASPRSASLRRWPPR